MEGKPIQGLDGQWCDQFGNRIAPPDITPAATTSVAPSTESQSNPEVVDPDVALLKGLSERCMAKHEGTYPNTLLGSDPHPELGRNRPYLDMTDEEGAAIERLTTKAQEIIRRYQTAEPLWTQFETALLQRREIVGVFPTEENDIIEDPAVTSITLDQNGLKIRVPQNVRTIYLWGNRISQLAEDLRLIRAGLAEGRMADKFGRYIYNVHSFVKQTSQ